MNASRAPVFTIGHSNQEVGDFLRLLARHAIDLVVDVRSVPRSKYAVQFDALALSDALEQEQIEYSYLGNELGGRPQGDEFYDAQGHVLYSRLAESDEFFSGILQLRSAISRGRVAVMCSEEDPTFCHRRLLIGRVLFEQGHPVLHIRKEGVQSEEEMKAAEAKEHAQLSLLAPDEEAAWRSARPIRSVSPSTARKSFSSR